MNVTLNHTIKTHTSTCFGEEWLLQRGSSLEPQKCVQNAFVSISSFMKVTTEKNGRY